MRLGETFSPATKHRGRSDLDQGNPRLFQQEPGEIRERTYEMDILSIVERIGEAPAAALFGLITGLIFGVAAQRSRFCLRAATVEFARGDLGPKVSVWLLTFSTALVWVQGAQLLGLMQSGDARMMAVTGSWSGAIIGGVAVRHRHGAGARLFGTPAGAGGHRQPALCRVGPDLCRGRTDEPRWLAGPGPQPAGRDLDDDRRAQCRPAGRDAGQHRSGHRSCRCRAGPGAGPPQPDRRAGAGLCLGRRLCRCGGLGADLWPVAGQL